MMGRLKRDQGQLFYCFKLEEVVPQDHQVRRIAEVFDVSWVHTELAPISYAYARARPGTEPPASAPPRSPHTAPSYGVAATATHR